MTPSRVQFQEAEDDDGDRRDPSKIKNFFTWVSSKAGLNANLVNIIQTLGQKY